MLQWDPVAMVGLVDVHVKQDSRGILALQQFSQAKRNTCFEIILLSD